MSPLLPMMALLALAASPQAPDATAKAPGIASFVGADVAAVVRVDLARWQAGASARRVLGKLADDPDLGGVASVIDTRVEALKAAGASEVFFLIDPADMPGPPLVVVPLSPTANPVGVGFAFTGGGPGTPALWPKSEVLRGALVAGSLAALARVRDARPASRPELAEALASGGDATLRIALIPTNAQRRVVEESFPTLPPSLGGGPIEVLSRGMSWASITMTTEPRASLRVAVKARDAESAGKLEKVTQDSLGLLASASRSDPAMAGLAEAVTRIKPEVAGSTIRLEADLETLSALVTVPALSAREAARRSECVNNMKQIGLAMHNYLSANENTFPPAFVASKDGKPLLSWRVLILPYLEQKELYDQFHLDEAWDSPHNKPLIARMPPTYACPDEARALVAEGKTTYLTPRGPASMFPGAVGVKIQEVTDGTSNTVLVVEANDDLAVTWTKPDDWSIAPEFSTRGLFGHHPRGTNIGFADGSVKFLKEMISAKLWRSLSTRNGGEIVSADDY